MLELGRGVYYVQYTVPVSRAHLNQSAIYIRSLQLNWIREGSHDHDMAEICWTRKLSGSYLQSTLIAMASSEWYLSTTMYY